MQNFSSQVKVSQLEKWTLNSPQMTSPEKRSPQQWTQWGREKLCAINLQCSYQLSRWSQPLGLRVYYFITSSKSWCCYLLNPWWHSWLQYHNCVLLLSLANSNNFTLRIYWRKRFLETKFHEQVLLNLFSLFCNYSQILRLEKKNWWRM